MHNMRNIWKTDTHVFAVLFVLPFHTFLLLCTKQMGLEE